MSKPRFVLPSFVGALLLSLFFSGLGNIPSFPGAISSAFRLISDTLTGNNVGSDYYGFQPGEMWVTLRLILVSLVFACVIACIFFWVVTSLKNKLLRTVIEIFLDILELIPETMYIICTVLVVIVLIERYQINLPIFPVSVPNWVDTIFPALALAVPSSLYLFRVLAVNYHDEVHADYAMTAKSKGLSDRRMFIRHVLPNVISRTIAAIPVITATMLSSAMFTEYFFGYQGMLFRFSQYAGWQMDTGEQLVQKQRYIAEYNIGAIVLVLFILVVTWFISVMVARLINRAFFPPQVERQPGAFVGRVQKSWVVIGILILLSFIIFGLFPELLTTHLPSKAYVPMWHVYGLSRFLPFGSDNYGRDVFSRILYGTPRTLLIAGIITAISVLGAFVLALLSVSLESRWMHGILEVTGRAFSPLPALAILFLVMLHRRPSSPYQLLVYITWLSLICIGRGAYAFQTTLESYFNFKFIEGIQSIGASRLRTILVNLRPWLWRYGLEFTFTQLIFVLALMVELAGFHTYPTVVLDRPPYRVWTLTMPPPVPALDSANLTWLSVIGPITTYYSYMSFPSVLYGPVVTILLFTIGAGCVAKGLRGKVRGSE